VADQETDEGRFFEDLPVGEEIKHWPGRTVTEFDDTWFSLLTMNANPLHFDAHYAARSPHGQRVVNGMFVLSLAVGMSSRDISMRAVANLGLEAVRHVAPVFHGDTLYARSRVLDARRSRSKGGRGIVRVQTSVRNQDGRTVLEFERIVMLPLRDAAETA
jgi:acyl dehydratase